MVFVSSSGGADHLLLLNIGSVTPTTLATFDSRPGFVSHGAASPSADRVAVVHPATSAGARLTIVDVATGFARTSPILLDENAPLVWSADGNTLLTNSSASAGVDGRNSVTLVAVNASSGAATSIAVFEDVFQAHPLGIDTATGRVLVAVVNTAGSSLWAVEDGRTTLLSNLSSGRTRDWRLSADGTAVAYIETRNGAEVPSLGRVAKVETGESVLSAATGSAQEGVAWRPGDDTPTFGGPGSTLNLPGSTNGAYLVPSGWAPLGDALVARVVTPGAGETSSAAWEIVFPATGGDAASSLAHGELSNLSAEQPGDRQVLFRQAGTVRFLGWVQAPGFGEGE